MTSKEEMFGGGNHNGMAEAGQQSPLRMDKLGHQKLGRDTQKVERKDKDGKGELSSRGIFKTDRGWKKEKSVNGYNQKSHALKIKTKSESRSHCWGQNKKRIAPRKERKGEPKEEENSENLHKKEGLATINHQPQHAELSYGHKEEMNQSRRSQIRLDLGGRKKKVIATIRDPQQQMKRKAGTSKFGKSNHRRTTNEHRFKGVKRTNDLRDKTKIRG